jgi:hypothetical protein
MTHADEADAGRALAKVAIDVVRVEAYAEDSAGNELEASIETWADENPHVVFEEFARALSLAGFEIVRKP